MTNGKNWRCTLRAAVELTGCPVATPSRGAISGAKVAGQQRCGQGPHGFFPPRLDWSQSFTLPKDARAVDVRAYAVCSSECILSVSFSLCVCVCVCVRVCGCVYLLPT